MVERKKACFERRKRENERQKNKEIGRGCASCTERERIKRIRYSRIGREICKEGGKDQRKIRCAKKVKRKVSLNN